MKRYLRMKCGLPCQSYKHGDIAHVSFLTQVSFIQIDILLAKGP